MAAPVNLLSTLPLLLLLLFLVNEGASQPCSLADIQVLQTATGKAVGGKPQYEVVVVNGCACSQTDLRLQCSGFRSVEAVDRQVLRKEGDECVVNGGQHVYSDETTFTYAWDMQFELAPLSSTVNCS